LKNGLFIIQYIGAKELTVLPGQEITIQDSGVYGCILTQDYDTIGSYLCETADILYFGQLRTVEFFVGYEAARAGISG